MKSIEVVAAIIVRDGKIFATQRGYGDFKDMWEFPGGKMEPGESPEAALKREIREELATEIEVDSFVCTIEHDYPTFHLTMHNFLCHVVSGELSLLEHEAARWLDIAHLDTVNWLPADLKIMAPLKSALAAPDPATPDLTAPDKVLKNNIEPYMDTKIDIEPKIREIDLKDYQKAGEGATGSSYNSLVDSNIMVKFFNDGYPQEQIINELGIAQKVFDLGIPSPDPGELVTAEGKIGISFRRIVGKRSYSRIFADEPDRIEEFSREFARYCLQLHHTECPKGLFPDVKADYYRMLEMDKYLNESEKQVVFDFISSTSDDNKALHGDLHFGNAISTIPVGAPLSTPHQVYFIDLGNFSQGDPLFDLGMFHNICLYSPDGFLQKSYHIDRPAAIRVWEAFVDEYFGGKLTPKQADELLMPYQALKMLFVEYATGTLLPLCERNLRESFGL